MKELYFTLIFSIMITTTYANSPVTATVKLVLDAVSLPNGIRSQIHTAQIGKSARRNLETEITYNYSQKGYNYNEIIRYYLNDTINPNGLDSVIKTVKGFNAPDNLCAVTKAYLAKGDYVKAQETVNDASAGGICNYLNTLIKIAQNPEGIYAVKTDMLLREEVALIAADPMEEMRVGAMSILVIALDELSLQQEVAVINSDAISVADQSVLTWMQENPFQEWLEPINTNHRMFHYPKESNTNIKSPSAITFYPNPANTVVNIDYVLSDGENNASISIYNAVGALVKTFTIAGNIGNTACDISELKPGIYLVSIVSDNDILEQQKLNIIR